jgi:eukaryotic-like serine/threonine-protein kinase
MPLGPGTRLGPYEILSAIGAGGMGEVYRARDTKLGRDVALKVLPESFAADAERVARIHREAQVLAALNHPNIGAIYGFEDSTDVHALVLEFVDGETLADRIARGAIPLDEALPIARQIAEALEAAHEQGIIHRDLKPANIKLRPDGTVKVLDFGLAKLNDPNVPNASNVPSALSMSPTITSPAMMTGVGVLLGTAAYMAPEQAKGRPADKRSDIWAFGCVLYEMLAGKCAFDGEDVSDTLAAVLRGTPDVSALPADLPAAFRTLIEGCLDKDRRRRIGDVAVVQFVFNSAATLSHSHTSVAPERVRQPWRTMSLVAAAVVAGSIGTSVVWLTLRSTTSPPRVSRLMITPQASAVLATVGTRAVAITPDGSRVIYVGANGTQLFVRQLDSLEPTSLFTGIPRGPFVSPDSEWVGFADRGSLKKVAVTGGPAVTIVELNGPFSGASWAPDDTIIFASAGGGGGLRRVSAAGGTAAVLTTPDPKLRETRHLWPEMLPGGRAVLFTIATQGGDPDAASQIAVLDLQTQARKVLVRGGSHGHYVSRGHLVYAAAGVLHAVAFDSERSEIRGTPVPVLADVFVTENGGADLGVADDGTLAYVSGSGVSVQRRTLAWVDRQGKETPIAAPPRAYRYARLSPDGTRVALDIRDEQNDIWVWDLARQTLTRLTFDPGLNRGGVWTPDGRRLVFAASRTGAARAGGEESLYWQMADGSGTPEALTKTEAQFFPTSFSPDGTRLLFDRSRPPAFDIAVLALDGTREITNLLQTSFSEMSAEVSPDGRWLAYQSNESGRPEVYVRPFPDVNAGRWQISNEGGTRPMWAHNGRELFYLVAPIQAGTPIDKVVAVPVQLGTTFSAGTPHTVLTGPYVASGDSRSYDVTPDGQRFLMLKDVPEADNAAPRQLVVVQNWGAELNRLAPAR